MSVLTYSTAAASNSLAMPAVGSLAEGVTPINLLNNFMRQQAADIAQLYGDAIAGIYTTGTASAYVVTTASGHTAYLNTMALRLRFHVDAAGGATTINVNGLGVKSLKVFVATGVRDPIAGEIKTDMVCDCIYVVALNCVVVTGQAIDLTGLQPADADLTALAALATTGLVARTGAGTVAARTITAGAGIVVNNGDGVAANPTITALNGEVSAITASGAAVDFPSIPSYVSKISITFVNVSLTTANTIQVRIGNSGTVDSTGYVGGCVTLESSTLSAGSTTGFLLATDAAAQVVNGVMILEKEAGFTVWLASASLNINATGRTLVCSGQKALVSALTNIQVVASGGAFDSGRISVRYS